MRARPIAASRLGALTLLVAMTTLWANAAPKPQDEKVLLRFKADVGQTIRSKSTSKIEMTAFGQTLVIEQSGVGVTTVKAVSPDGQVTLDSKQESMKMTLNGEELPEEELGDEVTTTVYAANGSILSIKSSGEETEDPNAALGSRIAYATNVIFSDNPVGVGDTWSAEVTGDDKLGTRNGKADFTLEGFEDRDGVRTARIKVSFRETTGSPAIAADSTQWVSVASGEVIEGKISLKGAEFDLQGQKVPITLSGDSNRLSGSQLAASANANPTEEKEAGEIEEKIKDFEKIDGLFTMYRKVTDGRTQLFLELKKDQLDQLVMLQTTASTGIGNGQITAGDPINDLMFAFHRTPNNRVVMRVPVYGFRAGRGLEIDRAVERSFPESFVESFSIEAEQDDKILVDFSNFFRSDISRIGELLQGGGNPLLGGGGGSYSIDRENSYVESLKNFPTNVYAETVFNFVGRGGGGGGIAALLGGGGATTADDRSMVIRVNYNMYMLPVGNGYQPRMFDPRVGYFTVDHQDFSDTTAIDQKQMFITRWHLVKKDPTAALSEPVEPIVFWIDNAVPAEFRESVKKGILSWNKAFEAAGFKNAVVAKQMPDDAEFDHADMRYNVVRWVTSPSSAYAIALFRTNPLTGQILNASVTVDANIVRAFASEYGQFVRPEAWQEKLAKAQKAAAAHSHHECNDPTKCTLVQDGALNMATGALAAAMVQGVPGVSRNEYINQFITWLVAHEIGHNMGLRHNFVASTLLDLNQLGDAATVDKESTSASVMDYVAFNPSALNGKAKFYGEEVGRYDIMAIQYGYTPFAGKNTVEERFDLSQIATTGSRDGLAWLGDEYADSIDPYITRFDLAKDPLAYWTRMGTMSRTLLFQLDTHSPKDGQSYFNFTRDFNVLLGTYAQSADQLTRFIGGVRFSPAFKGDKGGRKPIENIDGTRQKAALNQIMKMIFAEDSFAFPKHYYQMLATNPKAGLIEGLLSATDDRPMFDRFSAIQSSTLGSLMNPDTLRRVANQEFEADKPESTLRLIDLFEAVRGNVWSELATAKPTSMLRRQLQREHADALIQMVLQKSVVTAEARAIAWSQLRALKTSLEAQAVKTSDRVTALHWAETAARIERALDAEDTIGVQGGGGGGSLLDMLLGGAQGGAGQSGTGKSGGRG